MACGALVLYETADFAAVGGEERNDGAAVADGYFGVLGCPSFAFGACQGVADLCVDLGGLAGFGAPNLGKGRGGVVVELAVVVDEFSQKGVDDIELRTLAAVAQFHFDGEVAQGAVLLVLFGGEEIVAFADGAKREFQVEEAFERYDGVAHAEVGEDGGEVDEILLGEVAFHEHNLAHLLHELKLVAQWLVVGGESHLVGHADGEGVGALFRHHLADAVESQFLFYIVHLVEVEIKGPAVPKGVEAFFVEGEGDDPVGRWLRFGQRESLVVDEGAVARVFAAHAILSAAVATQHIAKVLDGPGLEEGGPGFVAAAGPVGADEQQIIAHIVVAQPFWEAQVVADGGLNLPAFVFEHLLPGATADDGVLAADAEGVGFIVVAETAVGVDPMEAVVTVVALTDNPRADEKQIVVGSHPPGPLESGAFLRLCEGSHVVAEAGGESLGNDEDVALGGGG